MRELRKQFPETRCSLDHRDGFQLLVATILSAQCTDARVNMVTPGLFRQFAGPGEFAEAPLAEIEEAVRSTGFFKNKAKAIQGASRAIVEEHGGELPRTMAEMVKLPGVGRKTANVVLGEAFGTPDGVVVDTHVARISQRLGLTTNKDPEKIEFDLMEIIPESAWSDFSLRLVYFGRQYCTARNPKCPECPISRLCNWPERKAQSA